MISVIGVIEETGERYIIYDIKSKKELHKGTCGYDTFKFSKEVLEKIKKIETGNKDKIQEILNIYY